MQAKRILVAPLDWGYGHATRCIPLIRELRTQGAEVILGGTVGCRRRVLQSVPGLEELDLPGYDIRYSRFLPVWLSTALRVPHILKTIGQEHAALQGLVKKCGIAGVISDNRYGLYHTKIPSVLLTHQLNLKFPRLLNKAGPLVNGRLHRQLRRFSEVWLPDVPPDSHVLPCGTLSGALSDPLPTGITFRYTGLLSRFQPEKEPQDLHSVKYDVAVVASGPSPQREEFLNEASEWVGSHNLRAVWVIPEQEDIRYLKQKAQQVVIAPDDAAFLSIIRQSARILCRSGYSSLSDWLVLNRGAILVPTPGQTEQEYLAYHLSKQNGFISIQQHELAQADAVPQTLVTGFNTKYQNTQLQQVVSRFLQMI